MTAVAAMHIDEKERVLDIVGVQVEQALNGAIAVEKLLEKPEGYYDLVFMDIQMPVMNGYEAARTIRSSDRPDLARIPSIDMTADAFAEDIEKSRAAEMR